MPVLSMFYGIIVSMYFFDDKRHKLPHIHARFQENEVVLAIPSGRLLEGSLPPRKMKLLLAWIEIHEDELMANWQLASTGQTIYKIEPLR